MRGLTLAALTVLAVAGASACKAGDTPPPQQVPGGTASPQDDAAQKQRELEKERTRVVAQAKLGVGTDCSIDETCPLYLRCIADACAVPPAVDGNGAPSGTPVAVIAAGKGEAQFYMETALDDAQRRRGLMWRPRMSDSWGMIFVYPGDRPLSFWMKNTLIPLDMIFIDERGKVTGVVHAAEPRTLTSRTDGPPARYVLELNAGLAKRYGIAAGNHVTMVGLAPEHMPRP
jgi:uncharacterized protein